jgi:spermidine/putrescine transport system substrate-binding protein
MSSQGGGLAPDWRELPADPSVIRGLTRRRLLGVGAAGVGALGLGGLLAACGSQPAPDPADAAGTPVWWRGQRRHGIVNFANWPDYIDVLHGRHPSLALFTASTGISVNYTEPVSENMPFYDSIRPQLEHGRYTGYDVIVTTTNSPALGDLMSNGWLIPLDQKMMANFRKYASPQVTNPPWDPGNTYTMAWQSGWTAIGYNSHVIPRPGESVAVLFDSRYHGRVGMMSDPWELGSIGLLRNGVWPALSTESDWRKAAATLRAQRDSGVVHGYYGQNYIDYLTGGQTVVSQAFSGDIYQARISGSRQLQLLMPQEGAMFWTDNMCIPAHAQNPVDAMAVMDFFYQPQVQAVVEYSIDYVCPVPAAQRVLLAPTGWAQQTLAQLESSVGQSLPGTAESPYVFPTAKMIDRSRYYYQFQNAEQLGYWNSLFEPIAAGQ